jgi:hypothetical protein
MFYPKNFYGSDFTPTILKRKIKDKVFKNNFVRIIQYPGASSPIFL